MTQIEKEVKEPVPVQSLAINAVNEGLASVPKKEKTAKVEIDKELLKVLYPSKTALNTHDKTNAKML